MAVRQVLRMGHPVLRERAREIEPKDIQTSKVQNLIRDLIDTMHAQDGVGIAAPQVGESLRLSIIEFEADNERYPEMGSQGLTVFINPVVTVKDKKAQEFWEGCLSVPGLRGLVARPRKVQVDYLNEQGEPRTLIAEDFLATVVQHEFDHLDGVLYVDRIQDTRNLAYLEEFRQFIAPDTENEELED